MMPKFLFEKIICKNVIFFLVGEKAAGGGGGGGKGGRGGKSKFISEISFQLNNCS